MSKKVMTSEIGVLTVKTKGRPVNPESKNFKFNERKAAGLVKRTGRPIDPKSQAAVKRADREAKLAAGEVIKRGRKKMIVAVEVVKTVKVKTPKVKADIVNVTPKVVNDVNVISELEVMES